MQPLYGHNSSETAYVVSDYPYGRLRCQIKFWLEHSEKKGFRFVSQTQNPKNGVWNKPKAGTYSRMGGNMFLDEKGHCHWRSISEFSSAEEVLSFLKDFPETELSKLLMLSVRARISTLGKTCNGKAVIIFNGAPVLPSENDIERAKEEIKIWKEAQAIITDRVLKEIKST